MSHDQTVITAQTISTETINKKNVIRKDGGKIQIQLLKISQTIESSLIEQFFTEGVSSYIDIDEKELAEIFSSSDLSEFLPKDNWSMVVQKSSVSNNQLYVVKGKSVRPCTKPNQFPGGANVILFKKK